MPNKYLITHIYMIIHEFISYFINFILHYITGFYYGKQSHSQTNRVWLLMQSILEQGKPIICVRKVHHVERESLWFGSEKAYGLGQGKVIVWDRETLWKLVAWGRGSVWFGEVEGGGLG